MQTQVAELLAVDRITLQNWERGATEPTVRLIPRILAFLGYDPKPEPRSLPRRIAYARRRLGLRQEDLAAALGASLVAIWQWETGQTVPPEAKLQKLQLLLNRAGITGITLR